MMNTHKGKMTFVDWLLWRGIQWSFPFIFGVVTCITFVPEGVQAFVDHWVSAFGRFVKNHFEQGGAK